MRTYLLVFLFLLPFLTFANIINIPEDYTTIQAGIDASVDGDTVLVQPGTYFENIDYNGKNITVASLFLLTADTFYISQTIIDGNANGRVVLLTSGENSTAVLTGFTLTNGEGGIKIHNEASPRLENLIITGNNCYDQFDRGGGIWIHGTSSPSLLNVIITDNSVNWGGGGGIYCEFNSSPSLTNVTITGNSCSGSGGSHGIGGGMAINGSDLSLENVIISGNTANDIGGGIYVQNWSTMSLVNVTISGNSAPEGGAIYARFNSVLELVNCILWNNLPNEIYCHPDNPSVTITTSYSDIEGGEDGIETNGSTLNWLEGNINEEPLFAGTGDHPYSILEDSPCIDTGTPDITGLDLPPWDILGNPRIYDGDGDGFAIIDMGAYEYNDYSDTEISVNVENIEVILQTDEVTYDSFNLSNIGESMLEYQIYTIDTTPGNRDLTGSYILCDADYYIPGATATWTFTVFNNSGDDEWINEVIIDFPEGVYVTYATDFQGGSGGDLIYDGMTGAGSAVTWFGETAMGYGVLHDGEVATAQVYVMLDPDLVDNLMIDYQINGDEYGEEPHSVNGQIVINNQQAPVEWITLEPASGVISAGESEVIEYQIDATSLLEGLYTCDILITGNTVADLTIPVSLTVIGTSAGEVLTEIPLQLSNYPNPFNPTTTISFQLSDVSFQKEVELSIYNIKGQKIRDLSSSLCHPSEAGRGPELVEGREESRYSVTWDGNDDHNQPVTSGIYLYKLQAGKEMLTRKMILLR